MARSRWRGGATPGSRRAATPSSIVATLTLTVTAARREASASTSTSRTISGPRVMTVSGVRASASASMQPRVSR